jgi:DNA-binding PadR family transcriptional regulator
VGNLLGLAVLSVVVQRPMHPYEMASVLRARRKDLDMGIKWGSLYTVVRNLEKHGLLAAGENTRQGGRPERTVYRITDAGREEFEDWVRELLSTPERERSRFEAALSVVSILRPDEVTSLLRRRLDLLEREITTRRDTLREDGKEIPRLFLIENEYELAVRDAEASWIRSLLDELTTGSFPGLAEWDAWHLTGHMSAELTELAERGGTPD